MCATMSCTFWHVVWMVVVIDFRESAVVPPATEDECTLQLLFER